MDHGMVQVQRCSTASTLTVNILLNVHRSEDAYHVRDEDGGWGGGREGDERVEARPRSTTRKTEKAVGRRHNNGSVKAVSPRHCAAASVLRNCCARAESQGQCPLHRCRVTT